MFLSAKKTNCYVLWKKDVVGNYTVLTESDEEVISCLVINNFG